MIRALSPVLAAALLLATAYPATAGGGPDNTVRIDINGRIQMDAPVSARKVPKQGIDSVVGEILGSDFACSYDFGAYSNPLIGIDGADETSLTIDGYQARIVQTPAGFMGLHMPEIGRTVVGATRLTISCDAVPEGRRPDIDAMFRSVQVIAD